MAYLIYTHYINTTLPLPEHRSSTPGISIEHYYTDEEIKTSVEIQGIKRRLYMGNEFNSKGINYEKQIYCEKRNVCGVNKINILEGTEKERVTRLSDTEGPNIALPKSYFAQKVLEKEAPFNDFDVTSFEELFRVLKLILDIPLKV